MSRGGIVWGTTRLDFSWDMNGDGALTIADIFLWIRWIATLPGDLLHDAVLWYLPGWAAFWEMGPIDWGGWGGFIWAIPVWAVTWVAIVVLLNRPGARPAPPDLY